MITNNLYLRRGSRSVQSHKPEVVDSCPSPTTTKVQEIVDFLHFLSFFWKCVMASVKSLYGLKPLRDLTLTYSRDKTSFFQDLSTARSIF